MSDIVDQGMNEVRTTSTSTRWVRRHRYRCRDKLRHVVGQRGRVIIKKGM